MPDIKRYDILVIGSGEAGKHLTWTLAQAGHRTAVVERKYVGGSCPNIACLPSKNVIRSAKAHRFARRGVWDRNRSSLYGYEGRPGAQAKDGGRRGEVSSRSLQGHGRGTDSGGSPVRGSEES